MEEKRKHIGYWWESQKKALFEEDYGKHAESSGDAMSEFDESMRSLDTSSRGQLTSDNGSVPRFPRLSFSCAARKLRSQMYKKNGSARSNKSISSCKILKSTNPNILSRIKLLAIVYIALRILQEDIQLSDILRWVEEGELSFYEITHFFPDDVRLRGHDLITFGLSTKRPSYSGLSSTAKELAFYLHVTHVPVPDLLSLAKRYIEELQLPVEIGKYVECIMALSPPSMKLKKSLKHFPNYEGRAMAFIIFVLKLLLGLDGKTEHEISRVTKKLNELCEGSAGATARLFVWEEWVQYIEYRKSVFGQFHFPTQASHYQEAFNNPNGFVKFWKRMKSKDTKRHNRLLFSKVSKMNPELVSAMKHVFMKLVEEETDDSTVEFVPSLTPQKANLEAIIAALPSAFKTSAHILKQDFTSTTLQHLIKPEQYIAMAHKKGTKIVIQKRSAHNQVKVVTKMKKKSQNGGSGRYMIVDTAERVQHSRHCKKNNKAKSKKQSIAAHESLTDQLLRPPRTFCRLPRIAESLLVKHLKHNGVCVETGNHFSSKNYRTDDSDTDNSTTSSSDDENPSCARITENDSFTRGSEIFGNLPVVAEDMLVRRLEKKGITSKLDDQLFHHSRQVNLPLAAKKVLLKHLKNHKTEESYLVKNKKYVLYMPYVEYWLNEVNTKKQTLEEFEREVIVEFPSSFRWLITECARMLQMSVQELYYELTNVEAMHCYLLRPQVESLSEDFKKNVELYW
ncbi:TATA box-binding protein-associated factor RNA polymerase I subunit B isoform X3 [Cryptotermes secundus]|uniref:TATA box-binding protein-associated factor RNA polymerase I subunit B isoform X3 n=1 Tax=Cryptotermes secundus TaxID=105785 RepID=UPI000CD7C70F|nr:TATA box-binding protein-associated factor RNA polymerase I subunit B isoform X3 [Cryptotermes secundus]